MSSQAIALLPLSAPVLSFSSARINSRDVVLGYARTWRRRSCVVVAAGDVRSGSGALWSWRLPVDARNSEISLSDVLWPSAGAFLAMGLLGRLDQVMAPKGVSFTIAPLGAVCAVLLTAPNSPAAQKYNMFVAQIACAAFGVLALSIFGPGWLARSAALASSIAFMIITRATHPPAASLPILFIDGVKFHQLKFWYMLFPGVAGCIILCLIQELVFHLKANYRF